MRSRNTQKNNLVLSLAFLTFYLNAAVRFFIPAVMPLIMIALHVQLGKAAVLITAYWVGYTIMQIPAGVVVDRFRSSRVNKVSFLAMSATFAIFYFALQNFLLILLIQFALGSLAALVAISDVSLIQTWFSHRNRTISVGIYQTAFFLGASLGEFVTISMAAVSMSMTILVTTVALFTLGATNLVLISDPAHVGRGPKRKIRISVSRGIGYVSLIRFSASFVYLGFLALFTTYLVTSGDILYSQTAFYSSLAAVGGIAGSPIGGIITDRLSSSKLMPALISTLLLSVFVIGIAFTSNFIMILTIAVLMGFLYGFYASPSMSIATELTRSDDEIGYASGFLNFSAQIGGAVSPLIIGYLTQATGNYSLSFVVIGVVSIIFLLPILGLMAKRNQDSLFVRDREQLKEQGSAK